LAALARDRGRIRRRDEDLAVPGDNTVGEFEPVGTHPEYRRRGLARALNLFGLRRLREAGAEHAIVGCRGDDDYPIPRRLYASVGFRELSRQLPLSSTSW